MPENQHRLWEDPTVTEHTLARARAGDEDAFRELTDPHRRELQVHIYRIVGSAQDAEDLLQETLLAAWRGLAQFEGRAAVRGWLHPIATNPARGPPRPPPPGPSPAAGGGGPAPDAGRGRPPAPPPPRHAEPIWLEPFPDALL